MPFGRGFGFRGWSPSWPYVGLGRGGLPRCWAYAPFWGGAYAYPYGYPPEYTYGPSSWGPAMAREEEKEWLKTQADLIRQQIDQINSRISELEKA